MCHAPAANVVATGGYRRCPSCGGLILDPYPTQQRNTVFVGAEAVARQQALEKSRRAYFLRHLLRLEKRMGPAVQNWRLMEIGCGSGVLLGAAIERGWQANGLEFSAELAAIAAKTNPAATVTVSDVLNYTHGAGDHDAVIALDVLEHVLDPVLMLKNCCALLKPGGLLLLQTPNTHSIRSRTEGVAWEMRDPAQHLTLCSPRGLRGLLAETGYRVLEWHTVSGSGTEQGWRRVRAEVKQWLLDRGKWGNALCVLARRG